MNHLNSISRLCFFTGKGGVGKSTLSLAYALSLKEKGISVLFVSAEENPSFQRFSQDLGLQSLYLDLSESSFEYISRKLGKIVALAITKAPFYKAVLNMVPGMNYIIFLGQMLDLLDKDPNLVLVYDAPASGHFITLLESLENFSHIFSSGILFEDIQRMQKILRQKDFLHTFLITLPTLLALQEANELQEQLERLDYGEHQILVNSCLSEVEVFAQCTHLPAFMQKKIDNEKTVFLEWKSKARNKREIPWILKRSSKERIEQLAKFFN